ncbi:DctP family TRAP transporter solute-binding subunit [bacterium LRH843]|nr:DctP family TRAP transporter solute-binding subunit [bacterium LRH843]
MKKSVKWMFMFVATVLIALTAACSSGSSSTKPSEAPANESDSEAKGEAAIEKIEINIAHGNQPDEPIGKLAEKWKELAAERSNGAIELKIYPSSQLGSEKDVVEQARMGNNVIIMTGYGFLMDYVPDAGIFDAPYLVDEIDDFLYLTTTDWFDGLRGDLEEKGIDIITANTVYGVRHLLTNEKVTTPEDLKGLKIRVPNNQLAIKTFEAMGAAATPTPLADLYTSLQQGLVDGAENPLPVLQGVKAQEVSKHLALTGHQMFMTTWMGGTEFIQTLPEDVVQILRETGDEAANYAREILEEQTKAVLAEFEAEGVEIHEIDTEPFKELVQSVYDEPSWSPGLYDEIQELLKNRP